MKNKNPYNGMNPEELMIKINDAADGLLDESELGNLENALHAHPDLQQDYRDIMNLPDLSSAYGPVEKHQNHKNIEQIFAKLKADHPGEVSFHNLSVHFFKKYALAASLLILAGISLFHFSEISYINDDMAVDEYFYPYEESSTDAYVLYLDEWIDM